MYVSPGLGHMGDFKDKSGITLGQHYWIYWFPNLVDPPHWWMKVFWQKLPV